MSKRALICGISGQDGTWLAHFLLSKNYEVWGTSRDIKGGSFLNHNLLGIQRKVRYILMQPSNFKSVCMALELSQPDEVYFLSGQSSVGISFDQPIETIDSTILGTLTMLEACRIYNGSIRFYSAGSSECFGDTGDQPATEQTPFHPRSPYAVAKASAFWLVDNYREAYGLYACTGILFNHESSLRPQRFVTQKIISTARRIASGSDEILELGRLDISRDWGWAPEYVEAMWLMLQQNEPRDYLIATGESRTLQEFVAEAFLQAGLNWESHVTCRSDLFRPTDILVSRADPSFAWNNLNWRARFFMKDVIKNMMNSSGV